MKRAAILLAMALCAASTPVLAQNYGGYTELQQEEAKLDGKVRELQLEAFRARLAKDDQKAKDLNEKLQKMQKRRVEVLQDLGKLSR